MFKQKISYLIENGLCNGDGIPWALVDATDYIETQLLSRSFGAAYTFDENIGMCLSGFKAPGFDIAYQTINDLKSYSYKDVRVAWRIIETFCYQLPSPLLPESMYRVKEIPDFAEFIVPYLQKMKRADRKVLGFVLAFLKVIINNQNPDPSKSRSPEVFAGSFYVHLIKLRIRSKYLKTPHHQRFMELIVYLIDNFDDCEEKAGYAKEALEAEETEEDEEDGKYDHSDLVSIASSSESTHTTDTGSLPPPYSYNDINEMGNTAHQAQAKAHS